ncbi:hypothetical protein GCM10009789_40010 [Kribbella sancticallisti]|uniref:Peptidase C14 caspase domain-containing protein n=1 Tax=Kribbella sancticallisti TaxID=460087 RepID=A0ABN2DSN5_9ACTN
MRLPDPAASRAVLIGTGQYEDSGLDDLPGVHANITDLELRLGDEHNGSFQQLQTVYNPDRSSAVGVLLDDEARVATDTFLVYYAGHGLVDRHGALHLGLSTTKPGHVNYTAMPFEFVRHAFLDSPATNRVLILDCCFSGRAIEAMSDPHSLVSGQVDIEGTYTLTSSAATQTSHAPNDARHTAFTGELLNLLGSGLPNDTAFITLDEIYTHLARRLTARGLPRPQRRGTGTAGQLALSRNQHRAVATHTRGLPRAGTDFVPFAAEFVVVTAQLPFDLDKPTDVPPQWIPRPSGLRTALRLQPPGSLRAEKHAWVGWPGLADERPEAFDDAGLTVVSVPLAKDEIRDSLAGFANAVVWPLYHDATQRPAEDRAGWEAYVVVNRRFAEATAEVTAENASVWVHDYQLQLVPAMLRRLRPDLRIGFFLDIPFPPLEPFMQLPSRTEIVRGLLGADAIGFHNARSATNFLSAATSLVGLRPEARALQVEDRQVTVGAFPGAVDAVGIEALARTPEAIQRARQIRADLGNPRTVLLSVQRLGHVDGMRDLDSTLGVNRQLQALYELLADGQVNAANLVAVSLVDFVAKDGAPTYLNLGGGIEDSIAQINSLFAPLGRPVAHYLQRSMSPEELTAIYLAADVLIATPTRDGMNSVAKEYIASRRDLDGAVVLSEFSGAAPELTSAFLANPYSIENVKTAILDAITVDPAEKRHRMRALRRQVLTHDSIQWADSFRAAITPEASPR